MFIVGKKTYEVDILVDFIKRNFDSGKLEYLFDLIPTKKDKRFVVAPKKFPYIEGLMKDEDYYAYPLNYIFDKEKWKNKHVPITSINVNQGDFIVLGVDYKEYLESFSKSEKEDTAMELIDDIYSFFFLWLRSFNNLPEKVIKKIDMDAFPLKDYLKREYNTLDIRVLTKDNFSYSLYSYKKYLKDYIKDMIDLIFNRLRIEFKVSSDCWDGKDIKTGSLIPYFLLDIPNKLAYSSNFRGVSFADAIKSAKNDFEEEKKQKEQGWAGMNFLTGPFPYIPMGKNGSYISKVKTGYAGKYFEVL